MDYILSYDICFCSLISKLDEATLFAQPSFKAILPLMDNYIPDVRQSEDHSTEEQMEEDMFLDAVVGMFLIHTTGCFKRTSLLFYPYPDRSFLKTGIL